jgi:hypothetical protein
LSVCTKLAEEAFLAAIMSLCWDLLARKCSFWALKAISHAPGGPVGRVRGVKPCRRCVQERLPVLNTGRTNARVAHRLLGVATN